MKSNDRGVKSEREGVSEKGRKEVSEKGSGVSVFKRQPTENRTKKELVELKLINGHRIAYFQSKQERENVLHSICCRAH